MTSEQLNLTGIIIAGKSGGFTGYFAEFPEAIAEGNDEKEVKHNMVEALKMILEFRRSESEFQEGTHTTSSFNFNLELA